MPLVKIKYIQTTDTNFLQRPSKQPTGAFHPCPITSLFTTKEKSPSETEQKDATRMSKRRTKIIGLPRETGESHT